MRRSLSWVTCFALATATLQAGTSSEGSLALHRNLPKDPLAVVAVSVDDPVAGLEELLAIVAELLDGEQSAGLDAAVQQLDAATGFSLEEELLSQLGPEIALSVDLPPIDYSMLALQSADPEAFSTVLGGVGLVAQVRDSQRVDRALRAILDLLPGETTSEEGCVSSAIPIWINERTAPEESGLSSHVDLTYRIHEGRMALGFSREWVMAAFEAAPVENKLPSGRDFEKVFAQLDTDATRLIYVNLPKVRDLVRRSHILTSVLGASPQTRDLLALLSTDDVMDIGLGSTARVLETGVRTTNFGPDWLAGPVMSSGLVAALVVPALVVSRTEDDQGQQRTVDDIRTIGEACEGFGSHTQTYPPTDGWVPVERIAFYLEPLYVTDVPKVDAWQNPILYWSDGATYRILSTGPDGIMDQDWSAVGAPGGPEDGDIVFGDGRFLAGSAR